MHKKIKHNIINIYKMYNNRLTYDCHGATMNLQQSAKLCGMVLSGIGNNNFR